ncbi:MAG: hypothetical protein WDO16_25970 [Bacteroidota bacterium]
MKKTLNILSVLLVLFSFLTMTGCDNANGLFGHSETKEEAKANGSTIAEYIPDKKDFDLLDGTKMQIDTAWTEISFTYKNGKRILDSTYGYHFSIPFKKEIAGSFTFSLSLADTTNRVFTSGMDEGLAQLCPRHLYKKMQVLLEQKDTDTSKGWKHPIITDTITFVRVK